MKKRKVESPKKETKNLAPPSSSPSPSSNPSFASLPNDILVNCFVRISRSYYPILSIVCKSFRSILTSADIYAARSRHRNLGNTEQCVYVCLSDPSYQFPRWFTLWTNPNQTLPDSMIKKKNKTGPVLIPVTSFNIPSTSEASIVVGSEIYVIGGPVDNEPSSTVWILDCCSHTWREAPSMIVARENAATCVYDGKIYVVGGCKGLEYESWAEVFDIKAQTWELLPHPGIKIPMCSVFRIVEMDGKIKFWDSYKMYTYDTKQSKWDYEEDIRYRALPARSEDCTIKKFSYVYGNKAKGRHGCWRYKSSDIFRRSYWSKVKGLKALDEMYKRNGGSSGNTTKLVSCGGKLLLIWEGYMRNPNYRKKIWCAEIVIEERNVIELWGKADCVDVVRMVPISCHLLHCRVVSVF